MTRLIAYPVALAAVLLCFRADACSVDRLPAPEMLRTSAAAVIAAPTSIAYHPAAAASPGFVGRFEQTVAWRVARRYTGRLDVGATFSTRETLDRNDLPCGISTEVQGRQERLMYLYGEASPFRFAEVDLADADQDLELLEAVH